jgi:hypothetical protein
VEPVIASEQAHGGNVHWVLREFPRQFKACRQRHTQAKTLLIVVIDADDSTTDERCRQLNIALQHDGLEPVGPSDPVSVLIPKRHIETWIRAATVGDANETDSFKAPSPTREQVRDAALRILEWARKHPPPDDSCVPSLLKALPHWQKIARP